MNEILEKKLPSIAKAMQKAYDDLLPQKTPRKLETHNSLSFLKWDCINTCLKELDGSRTFEVRKTRRGSWSFLLLFESDSQTIITLIRRSRFKNIQKSRSDARPQYLREIICVNNKLKGDGAPYLFWDDAENKDFSNAMTKECESFSSMKDIAEARHVFVVFDDFNDQLSYLSAIVVDSNFFQVGSAVEMLGLANNEVPLETVPVQSEKSTMVRLSAIALKIREERSAANQNK